MEVNWIQWVMTGALTLIVAFLSWMTTWCMAVGKKMDLANENVGKRITEVEAKFTNKLDTMSTNMTEVKTETLLTKQAVGHLAWQDKAISELQERVRTLELTQAGRDGHHH